METIPIYMSIHDMQKFKSYYVVWKQECKKMEGKEYEEFKSYYVVWKRIMTQIILS